MYHTNEDFGLLRSRKRTAGPDEEEEENAHKKARVLEGRAAGEDVPISPRFLFVLSPPYYLSLYYRVISLTHAHIQAASQGAGGQEWACPGEKAEKARVGLVQRRTDGRRGDCRSGCAAEALPRCYLNCDCKP